MVQVGEKYYERYNCNVFPTLIPSPGEKLELLKAENLEAELVNMHIMSTEEEEREVKAVCIGNPLICLLLHMTTHP